MTQAQATVTPLRQRMLDDMKLRNMAKGTRRSYVHSVADFSAFHGRSPDELTLEDVRDYQLHLVARGHTMHEHAVAAQQQEAAFRQHVQHTAGPSTADELATFAHLEANGTIDDAEYDRLEGQSAGLTAVAWWTHRRHPTA